MSNKTEGKKKLMKIVPYLAFLLHVFGVHTILPLLFTSSLNEFKFVLTRRRTSELFYLNYTCLNNLNPTLCAIFLQCLLMFAG